MKEYIGLREAVDLGLTITGFKYGNGYDEMSIFFEDKDSTKQYFSFLEAGEGEYGEGFAISQRDGSDGAPPCVLQQRGIITEAEYEEMTEANRKKVEEQRKERNRQALEELKAKKKEEALKEQEYQNFTMFIKEHGAIPTFAPGWMKERFIKEH